MTRGFSSKKGKEVQLHCCQTFSVSLIFNLARFVLSGKQMIFQQEREKAPLVLQNPKAGGIVYFTLLTWRKPWENIFLLQDGVLVQNLASWLIKFNRASNRPKLHSLSFQVPWGMMQIQVKPTWAWLMTKSDWQQTPINFALSHIKHQSGLERAMKLMVHDFPVLLVLITKC